MIYASLKNEDQITDYLFNNWPEYHKATFCPDIETICLIELDRTHGKTYQERKSCIENKAIEFSNNQHGGLSWSELFNIESYFRWYGRRYGLLNEFRENAIC